METFTKGDVVLFPFPFTNLSSRKLRPCLVLSKEMGNDVLLCQITSKQIPANYFSVSLQANETKNGTLEIDSYVRTNMLFTAETKQIIRKICSLNEEKYKEIIKKIMILISL